jgi:hypothetical protein
MIITATMTKNDESYNNDGDYKTTNNKNVYNNNTFDNNEKSVAITTTIIE